ncbi:unnamed protein product [Diplocarpon coronariae]|uniref:Nuclear pore complex subunit Nup133 n=1 Tax=Diplocarpon coronariae TaxID=2795749 RepID=A0A218YRJ8_9HELO|nr:hypothetical protein B2J93_6786 [Marssonina coronariae]
MFSPQINSAPATERRTSKRRLRSNGADSIKGPATKKMRMGISNETFVPPEAAQEMEETKGSKTVTLARSDSSREPVPIMRRDMTLRAKKSGLRSKDRVGKGDGSTVLTTNDTYTVSKLPALPDQLRAEPPVHQHGSICPENGYALALTHHHAIVWQYHVNSQSPESFVFTLPYPPKHVTDPLPIGSLVSPSASASDPGLVVVIPSSGKITYWESTASAATIDLRLKRNGVELSITGMISGETVIQIVNAESAGFVLAFSTGRIAYMNVRDGQGRPSISVQFLRNGNATVGGGLLGSLRNALSSSAMRGDIAAVRAARPENVGERKVVLATTKGRLQSWDIHRGGHATINGEAESREAIVMAIKATAPALSDLLIEGFEIHDFTFTPKPVTDSRLSDQEDGTHLLLLTSMAQKELSHYFLVEAVLIPDGLVVGNIRSITSYTNPVNRRAASKPRLLLPNPGLIAYIVFDCAVVIVSMAKQPDSPDLQLRSESHILSQAFEDVIDFRHELDFEIVGSGMEEPHGLSQIPDDPKSHRYKGKYPAAVLLVRGGGVVRVAATNMLKLSSSNAQKVTAKSKLEQAVFFGSLEQNPLSFAVRPELKFPSDQVGEAAVELSQDILRSDSPHIKDNLAVDKNLKLRSTALRDLAKYLKTSCVVLDRITKWKLLWDAEKIAAATIIWKYYDECIRAKPEGQKRGLLAEMVEFIHENYKTEPVEEAGELDRVRHWFIKDIWNLEVAIPWAYQVIKYTFQDGQKDAASLMNLVSEANDLVVGGINAALDFRSANLDLYGLNGENLEHGILEAGYNNLPVFWTSTFFVTDNLRKQASLTGTLLTAYWDIPAAEGSPHADVLRKVRGVFPALLDISIRSNTERTRWNRSQEDQDLHEEANKLTELQTAVEDKQILSLATDLGLTDEAIILAEKHELLNVLAKVVLFGMEYTSAKVYESGSGRETLQHWKGRSEHFKTLANGYFAKFGTRWASALFEHAIFIGDMDQLLNRWKQQQPYLTEFFRGKPDYAKISWINDITEEEDLGKASSTLLDLGLHRESELWNKKIELSMGKMALLASRSHSQTDGILIPDGGKTELKSVHNQLGLIKIQNQVYEFVRPSIENAIDENAELQLALESHGNKALRKKPMFARLLADSMELLIKHQAMDAAKLIDLLTLIGDQQAEEYEEQTFQNQRFFLAIQASRYGIPNKDERVLAQRIIWRRCMLVGDWSAVNNTSQKDDQQVQQLLSSTALYQTFKACLNARLFEKNTNVKPIGPREVLGAGSDNFEERFASSDDSTLESIMKDMQVEDDALEPLIEKYRLEQWFETIYEQAKQKYELDLEEQTDDGSAMQQGASRLAEIEQGIRKNEQTRAESLLHSKPRYKPKAKGSGNSGSFRHSIKF